MEYEFFVFTLNLSYRCVYVDACQLKMYEQKKSYEKLHIGILKQLLKRSFEKPASTWERNERMNITNIPLRGWFIWKRDLSLYLMLCHSSRLDDEMFNFFFSHLFFLLHVLMVLLVFMHIVYLLFNCVFSFFCLAASLKSWNCLESFRAYVYEMLSYPFQFFFFLFYEKFHCFFLLYIPNAHFNSMLFSSTLRWMMLIWTSFIDTNTHIKWFLFYFFHMQFWDVNMLNVPTTKKHSQSANADVLNT